MVSAKESIASSKYIHCIFEFVLATFLHNYLVANYLSVKTIVFVLGYLSTVPVEVKFEHLSTVVENMYSSSLA